MAKKNWIYIKRGLSEDPKHRAAMGECVWLFLHIIDRADWETGIAYDWKDEQEAADMAMPVRTLREQRRKLDELNYISCKQRQYGQDIIIKNWTNPRDYSGKVLNQGGNEASPQGYTQGYTQGSSQDVTPTSDSLSKSLSKERDIPQNMPIEWYIQHGQPIPEGLTDKARIEQEATSEFESAFGFSQLPWDTTSDWQFFKGWVVKVYQSSPGDFRGYVEWRGTSGKYDAMSNKQIRLTPRAFVDTGYPTFKAKIAISSPPNWQDRSHPL